MARVIAICNQKGGVGKTTTAVNTGAYLALAGKRALLVDFDPQANASSALGGDPLSTGTSIYHGIIGAATPAELIRPSALYNYHYIPSAPHLAGALIELVNAPEREYFLRKFLNQLRHAYDYILIDLPPSLSLLTVNGLLASDEVLIPVQAEHYSLEGLGQLLSSLELIRTNMGHHLTVNGALVTMLDKDQKFARQVVNDLRANFPHPVFTVEVPRHAALAEAPSFMRPIPLYRPDSPGAEAYARLADEIIRQEERILAQTTAHQDFGNFNIPLAS